MKKFLLLTAVVLTGLNAFAIDELNEIVKCRPAKLVPDAGLSVVVSQGGIAGITQITVNRFFLGHHSISNHIVRQVPFDGRMGAPMTFKGQDISLSVNFTTAPAKDGSHPGTLIEKQADGSLVKNELSCKR